MKDITISGKQLQEALEAAMPKVISETLTSSYSSPLAKVIGEELNSKEGVFRQLVSETISGALSDPEFKTRLADKVLENIISRGLKGGC